jgi:hypothetical protein
MLAKRAGLAAIAAIAGLIATSASADAGTRLRFLFPFGPEYDDYYSEPYFVPSPRYYYYQPRPRLRPRYYSYQYEPDYYEPEIDPGYIPPPRKKTTKLPSQKSTSLPPQKSVTKPAQKKSAGISCDKATKIVSGYGFTQVRPTGCTGKVYAFNAQRDGKPFMIKMSSASGELTEVKKQ